jgi:hypothetical protein
VSLPISGHRCVLTFWGPVECAGVRLLLSVTLAAVWIDLTQFGVSAADGRKVIACVAVDCFGWRRPDRQNVVTHERRRYDASASPFKVRPLKPGGDVDL